MTEEELRAMVRQAIATMQSGHTVALTHALDVSRHPLHSSHRTFTVPSGSDGDGLCLIEPAVTCNHCGYCKSMGH